jgi:hypothetical protein
MRVYFILLLSLFYTTYSQSNHITLTGQVINKNSKESISNCNIIDLTTSSGTTSDSSGLFKINLSAGIHKIKCSCMGFITDTTEINISDASEKHFIKIELIPTSLLQNEVNIIGKIKYSSVESQGLTNSEIKKMPSFNNDVLQSISIMPGVTANNELSNNYNVRGGSFTENLIYLNGFEIYRPSFIKNGMQENQSIVNPDLVRNFTFYNGAFPAEYGDKNSSVLEIIYNNNFDSSLAGIVHTNLLYSGAAIRNKYKNLNWAAAARYTYPTLLMKSQQTAGTYNPVFWDGQFLINYTITPKDKIELLAIYASNNFDLKPQDWQGAFTFGYQDVHVISGNYSGFNNYLFNIGLAGFKYTKSLDESSSLTMLFSYYNMVEKVLTNLTGNFYYSPDGNNLESDKEFLKSSYETADDNLDLKVYELNAIFNKQISNHQFSAGTDLRFTHLRSNINESYYENGPQATQTILADINSQLFYNLNAQSFFIQDVILLGKRWKLNVGSRVLHYNYNKETLISPRAGIYFYPSDKHSLKFTYGYYYQPPFFQELKNTNGQILKSQLAIHYILGWDYQFKNNVKLLAEVYYKKLEQLIPFDLDEVKINYFPDKITSGYARGFDLQVQGEFVRGAQSWVSYSYLDTKELVNGEYIRRLLDQTHTLQIFLQDRFPKHPNWQAHVRLLLGSGYLFYPEFITTDANGRKYLRTDFNRRYEYAPYFRTDMGLTTEFDLTWGKKIIFKLDVLNVFNKQNNSGYRWVQVEKDSNAAIAVLQQISGRFFNIGIELEF